MDETMITQLGDQIKGVAADLEKMRTTADDVEKAKADLSVLAERSNATAEQLDVLAKDVAQYRKMAESSFGKSGGVDFRQEFSRFIQAAYWQQKRGTLPDHLKTAADYVTTTDAQGGYFVPDILMPTIREITETHGQLWPYFMKITVPPGKAIDCPYDSTLPTMTWRVSQGGEATQDAGPIAFGADNLRPVLLADYVKFANELLQSADINIADAFAMRMISKGVRAIETGVLIGDEDSSHPSDGIIQDAGDGGTVNTETALATPTFANVATFVGEAIDAIEGAADRGEYQFITTDAVATVLASEAVGSSELTGMLTWGDPRRGVPGSIMGYDFLTHPSCKSTTNRVVLAPLRKVVVAWSGSWIVDFNAFSGWTHNETWMMVKTHADYGLGNKGEITQAVVTSLS
jgi:HK97 family phage major capsid protein